MPFKVVLTAPSPMSVMSIEKQVSSTGQHTMAEARIATSAVAPCLRLRHRTELPHGPKSRCLRFYLDLTGSGRTLV